MKSILEEIYYCKRGNSEVIEASEEYWKVHKKYEEIYEKLEEGLNDKQKKLLDELFVQGGGLEGEMALSHFKEGFKLGLLVAVEAFD